ncbi:sensor domain-containing protein [Sinorhizobium fredii]|uniref:GGDEF/EAL domain-containing protein n=1 Tax=Rhizobium fredii TaxID=380 RepID=A0A2L0HA30_RHIFR|nr:EAL domain-containing protein [Sinorhizobium fredii]AUX78361.1 GGDEF/EAL domain-containing protein [Sinorhizobium fredii]
MTFGADLEVLLNAIALPIIVKDEQFRFRFLNEAACSLVGRRPGDLIGRTDYDIRPAAEADRIREIDKRVLCTGEEVSVEADIARAGGELRSLLIRTCRAKLTRTDASETIIVATILDVTEQRRVEAELQASEEHHRALVELHPQAPWTADPSGQVLEMGPRWENTGFAAKEALGGGWAKAMHPDDLNDVQREWSKSLKTGEPLDIEFRLAAAEGGYSWFRGRAAARRTEDGSIRRWYGTVENIDDRRKMFEALKESEARFRAIADDAPVMIWATGEDGEDDYHSRLWLETTGQTAEQAAGKGWLNAVHPDDRNAVDRVFYEAFHRRKPVQMEYRLKRAGGGSAWIIDIGQPRFATDGKFLGFVGIALDITERRNAEQERLLAQKQIHHMARHDALTGLPNRQFLREEFERLSDKIAPGTRIAVLCLDLDGFKAVNDAYGRATGDLLLRRVAERLQNCLRQSDILCRLGGGEFVVLRVGINSDAEARLLAQQLIDVIEVPYELAGTHVDLGVIVGLAAAPKSGQPVDELIKAADVALDRAKSDGRGTYVQYEPGIDAHLQAVQQMRVSLRQALENGDLEVHYQPLVNLHTGEITTFEALARWPHPQRDQVSPAEFIPVAEETGLIGPLGEWILRQACTEAVKWPSHIGVAVNLSPLQFRNRRLAASVCSILDETGLDASRLQLEITETVLLDDCDGNLQTLKAIRRLGVKIAIDDFGTGFSSLGYLRTFPFDKIKVDRSFITDLPEGRESLAIVRAVAAIGRSLGIVTTVEGVERKNQYELIKAEGFDEAQGYLIARPMPGPQALELARSARGGMFTTEPG